MKIQWKINNGTRSDIGYNKWNTVVVKLRDGRILIGQIVNFWWMHYGMEQNSDILEYAIINSQKEKEILEFIAL